MKIGLIGLGIMGKPMAKNLLKAGYDLTVNDRSQASVEDVVAVGDAIVVKVTDIDQQGRINLSRRDAILALEAKRAEQQAQQQ